MCYNVAMKETCLLKSSDVSQPAAGPLPEMQPSTAVGAASGPPTSGVSPLKGTRAATADSGRDGVRAPTDRNQYTSNERKTHG